MIDKRIMHVWIGTRQPPPIMEMCRQSWLKFCPDYEIVHLSDADIPSSPYTRRETNPALIADYMKAYYAYHRGGLVLDDDVEVLRPLDDLLGESFIAWQQEGMVNMAVSGWEPGSPFLKRVLSCYDTMAGWDVMPRIMTNCFEDGDVKVYPTHYFFPYNWTETDPGKENYPPEAYTVHHWTGTWHK